MSLATTSWYVIFGAALDRSNGLRRQVSACGFEFQGQPVEVTFSAGVTGTRPGNTPDAAFSRADDTRYVAKGNGPNRCERG